MRLGIVLGICLGICARPVFGVAPQPTPSGKSGTAEALYLQLSNTPLDPARVYQVRDASLDRAAIHITLEDGTLALTQDVLGRITGAFFEGEGEVLLIPPDEVERKSIGLFTGMAILEERFTSAYFRFNDDTAAELKPGLRAADNADGFISRWGETARTLAQADALRLLVTFSQMLPVEGRSFSSATPASVDPRDRMLHARLQGVKLGIFDIHFDSKTAEQIQAGQARAAKNGAVYYDIWTSFSINPASSDPNRQALAWPRESLTTAREEGEPREEFAVHRYEIEAEVRPPKQLNVEARLELEITRGGVRALIFELSRFLQLQVVEADGQPVEFIHNPAIEGTQISRRGNDLVVVILPEPTPVGQKIELRFVYGGEVLAEAGNGLLYVGARGTWYPNRGMAMSDFDLKFHYPRGWTLLATGKPMTTTIRPGDLPPAGAMPNIADEQTARWISERPIPVAGFNLGRYTRATAQAGNVTVESYAAPGVEREFLKPPVRMIEPDPAVSPELKRPQEIMVPVAPSPARNAQHVAEATAQALQYYSRRFGPFPYSHLALTQMPGPESQGWPGLVFLSSYAFLSEQERADLHMDFSGNILAQQVPAHETAHQWWGDLVTWKSYRDQWISEGLANYSSLMMLQEKNPVAFHQIMERYRQALVENKNGELPKDAGPVTLGMRLLSSHAPEGYEAISYGRGTWLFHMLRSMLLDVAAQDPGRGKHSRNNAEEPFVLALRKLRQRFEGKAVSSSELLEIFAEDLPPSLRYEGKASLDWFLQGWINGTALPKLQLESVKFTPRGNATMVSGTILQKNASEDLVTSVPIYAVVSGTASVFIGRVFADGTESSFHLSAPAGTRKLLLDPKQTILTAPK
jgi:hypothetical protein